MVTQNSSIRRIIISVMVILAAATCLAARQQPGYDYFRHFRTYGKEVHSIYRDPATGMVWLATSRGLLRYGDSPLENSVPVYPDAINKSIKSITGIGDGMLLLKTATKQYFIFDPVSNRIVVDDFDGYLDRIGIEGAKSHQSEIIVDNGDMWIYTGKKLYRCPRDNEGKAALRVTADDKILRVYINNSRFYVLTPRKLSLYDKKTSELIRQIDWMFPVDIRDLRIVEDGNGDIWIGNENLYRCEISGGEVTEVASNMSVTDMTVDKNGDVYVATNTHGIVAYDCDTREFHAITFDAYDTHRLKSNRVKTIHIDDDGNLWVGYSKQGLSISNPSLMNCNVRHIEYLRHRNRADDIISLTYDRAGNLWLGTDGNGLFRVMAGRSGDDGNISDIMPHGNSNDTSVTATLVDSSGRLWVGVYRKGLMCRADGRWTVYLENISPYSIVEDMYGNIYVGTLDDGMYCLLSGNAHTMQVDLQGRTYVPHLTCNRGGTIYVTTTAGLGIIDAATQKVEILDGNRRGTRKFSTIDLQSVFSDSRGLLWMIGSELSDSIEIFDIKNDSIMKIPTHTASNISSIIEDDNKNIWIASDDGIINIVVGYDTGSNEYSFRNYVYNPWRNDDEFRHFNYRTAAKAPDGTLVFGTTSGYLTVPPAVYSSYQESTPHKVYIESMKINSCLIKPGVEYDGRVILDKDIASTSYISLNSYENNLSFLVYSQDYSTPFKTRYYYRLDGLSENWMPVENHTIDLTNLAVGSYTLSICGQNPDGTMSSPLARLDLRINAPWYLSTWAYMLYVLLGICVISYRDILLERAQESEGLRLEHAEKEMQRQYQINEMKLRFFTNISHDFRTPLTLIITPLEAYLNNKKGNPDVKFFTPIYRNAVQLLNLINQILDFRKLEVYGETLNLSNGDVVAFVREVCTSFSMFADGNNVELKFSSSIPALHMAFDMDKLSKIMMNLLSNAFKHTPRGGKVYVDMGIGYDGRLDISVMDYGCGIPDADKERIFDRFYQNKCDNAANMGCGVGLHIVREYVALHNGSIKVTDNTPHGAVFTVSLPVVMAVVDVNGDDRAGTDLVLQEAEANCCDEVPVDKHSIMIVEDNHEFIDFLYQSLSDEYNVLRAANGEEAIAMLDDLSVDIVISDVMMDRMDGLELCRRIKTTLQYSHIPVILLTAKSMVEDEIQGFKVGADDYITKPFNLSVLKLRIQTILRSREQYCQNFKNKAEINPSEITITSLDEQFIAKALSIVEENMSNTDFSVEDLSAALSIHRAHLYRKLSGITGKTPIEFIRLIRLKRAKQYLEKSQMYISEIAYAVGFNSPKLFAKYFKEEFGMSPRDYQNSHNQETD